MVLAYSLRILKHICLGATSTASHSAARQLRVTHRARLVDVDLFFHVNNAMYLRVAELSRWNNMASTGLLRTAFSNSWMFLVVQQNVQYHRPIAPFEKFDVVTSLAAADDKWIDFEHAFVRPGAAYPSETEKPMCVINARTVVKRASGKTVRPSELAEANEWVRAHLDAASGTPMPEERVSAAVNRRL